MPIPPERRPRVVAVVGDLLTASRIEGAVVAAGGSLTRLDVPDQLPPPADVDLLVVDWGAREPAWGDAIRAWRDRSARAPRIVLFGPHTDLVAHEAARDTGLGPMKARSALFSALPDLLETAGAETR